ncbi:Ig-like domain-containing protein, partial [Kurthia sibirica]
TGQNVGTPTDATVKDAPYDADAHKPTIKEPTAGDNKVDGTGVPGDTIILKDKDGNKIGEGTVDKDGNYTIPTDRPLEKGEVITATPNTGQNVGTPTDTTVKDAPYDEKAHKPTIKELTEGDNKVDGTGVPGDTIILKDKDGNKIGEGTVGEDGTFITSTTRPLKKDEVITATPNTGQNVGTPTDATVKEAPYDKKAHKPTIKEPTEGDNKVDGTGVPGDTVILKDKDGNKIGEGTVDKDGNYSIKTDRPLKKDEVITATPNTGQNVGTPTDATVKEAPYDKKAHKPTIKEPTEGDNKVEGTGVPGDTIILKDKDGNKIGEGTVDKDGNYSIKTDRPLKKDEVITATPNTGQNVGTPTDATVKEAPYDEKAHKPTIKKPNEGDNKVEGTGVPGDTIILKDKDGNKIGEGTVDKDGNYSIPINRPLEKGEVITATPITGDHMGTPTEATVSDAPKTGGVPTEKNPIESITPTPIPNNGLGSLNDTIKKDLPNNLATNNGTTPLATPNLLNSTVPKTNGQGNLSTLPQTGTENTFTKLLLGLGTMFVALSAFMFKGLRRKNKMN